MDVWKVDLAAEARRYEDYLRLLSAEERARAARFHFERDRVRYVVSRGVLRIILTPWVCEQAGDIQFVYEAQGKPYIEGYPVQFNLSHSGDVTLIAVTRSWAVGVDVEQWRAEAARDIGVETVFFGRERARFEAAGEGEREKLFFRFWTLKEAVIKALGGGLSIGLERFEVGLAAKEGGGEAELGRMDVEGGEAGEWALHELAAPEGYSAALAVRGDGEIKGTAIRFWEFGAGG